jgi:glycosyltransferase involved in cell wall biosynthesis
MQDTLVSIVIPVFNAANFLKESIESALAQTWPKCELIIIDDHSSDQSWKIASLYRGPKVVVEKNRGRGAAAARNCGINLATGGYIQFLDADDLLSPEKIELQMQMLLNSPPRTIGSCAWGRFALDPYEAKFVHEPVWKYYSEAWKWLLESWEGGGMMQTACWLVPRTIVEEAGPWDESLISNPNDDGEYFSRILLRSRSVAYCPVNGVLYRSALTSSLSRRANNSAIQSAYLTCELYEQHVEDAGHGDSFHDALRMNYLNFIYQYHPSRKDLMRNAWRDALRLGGEKPAQVGGASFQKVASKIGFMNALRLRSFYWALGGQRQKMETG